MPRNEEEPHILKRKARFDKSGNLTHRGTWYIKHGAHQIATGCSFASAEESLREYEKAKVKLHEYNVARYKVKELPNGAMAHEVLIGDLIRYFLVEEGERYTRMKPTQGRWHLKMIERLSTYWGEKYVSDINRRNSLAYQKEKKASVVRNELVLLRSIINFCSAEGKVKKYDADLNYQIPKSLPSRIHHFSLDEAKRMYIAARRKCTVQYGKKGFRCSTHIARFIVVAIMTGTRADRICRASFIKEPGRPWVDLENGIFYRDAEGEFVPENKLANPIRIPDRLLSMMKLWHRGTDKVPGTRYLIEYHGRPVDCRKGFYTLKNEVFEPSRAAQLNRHVLKHTCVTWLLQAGNSIEDVARYVSTTPEIIRKVYSQLVPGEYSPINQTFSKRQDRRWAFQSKPHLKSETWPGDPESSQPT